MWRASSERGRRLSLEIARAQCTSLGPPPALTARSVFSSLVRTFSRPVGSLFTDLLGVSPLLEQSVAHMQEQMGLRSLHAAADVERGQGGGGATSQSPNPVVAVVTTHPAAPSPPLYPALPAPGQTGAYGSMPTALPVAYTVGGPAQMRPTASTLGYTTWSMGAAQPPPPGMVLVGSGFQQGGGGNNSSSAGAPGSY